MPCAKDGRFQLSQTRFKALKHKSNYLLEILRELLEDPNTLRLKLAREEVALPVLLAHLRPLLVVVHEEPKVLIRNVDIGVPAEPPVLLLRLLSAREPMAVDLVLDLCGRVRHVDARVGVRRAHLRLGALERREELGVDQCGLWVLELRGDVAR